MQTHMVAYASMLFFENRTKCFILLVNLGKEEIRSDGETILGNITTTVSKGDFGVGGVNKFLK